MRAAAGASRAPPAAAAACGPAPLTRAVASARGLAGLWRGSVVGLAATPMRGLRVLASVAPAPAAAATAAPPSSNIVRVLRARGLLNDVAGDPDELEKAADEVRAREGGRLEVRARRPRPTPRLPPQRSLPVYCGFDPTADSLHLGHLTGIVVLAWFRRCGHAPVALLGGATGRVGDPSGRSAERPVLTEEALAANVAGIKGTLDALLGREEGAAAGPPPRVVNNVDWFGPASLLVFLRDVGKHARVGAMLSRDSVRSRMDADGEGMSFTEFTYQLLQGYDFVHLAKEHGVRVQIGGSDQMGNVVAGLDLMRRINAAAAGAGDYTPAPADRCYGVTFPLLTKSDGTKMGKSADGAVWLNPARLSPFKFYQYLLTSVPDADVCSFLRKLTFLPLEDVAAVEARLAAGPAGGYDPNSAQRLLASEVTRFVHGDAGLDQALAATAALRPGAATVLDAAALEAAAGDGPSATLPRASVVGATLVDVLVAAGMQPSKAAARRLVAGGGVALNNAKVGDAALVLSDSDLIGGRLALLAAGKKNKLLLRVEG